MTVKENVKPGEFLKSVAIRKVDEKAQQAWGIFTAEVPDCDEEIADYAYQKVRVGEWSNEAKQLTAKSGQESSLGNVRFAHTGQPVGKVIALDMDDAKKEIGGGTYISDPGAWDMVAKGILMGFSFGGRYDWRKCEDCGRDMPLQQGNNYCDTCGSMVKVRFGASIVELSVCDRPAVPVANITHIKADGSVVEQAVEPPAAVAKEAKTKRVAGEDLTADCFAYVGDPEQTKTWKLPIKFSTEEKSKRHVRNALARFGKTKGIPDDKKAEVKAKIVAAAKHLGIEVDEDEAKSAEPTLKKSFVKGEVVSIFQSHLAKFTGEDRECRKDLGDVAFFAEILQRIAWLRYSAIAERDYEGDESTVPDEIEENLVSLTETFLRMAEEEAGELIAAAKKAEKGTTVLTVAKTETPVNEETSNALTGHIAEVAAHHAKAAEAHKAAAAIHTAHAAVHKSAHEHFKAAAAEGGEHEMHHAMHANFHKSGHEHHMAMAEHHEKMHKMHTEMVGACGKVAKVFCGDSAEKLTKYEDAVKAAAATLPSFVKSAPAAAASGSGAPAIPLDVNLDNLNDFEKAAFMRQQEAWLASPEYTEITQARLRQMTVAKLNAVADAATGVVNGVDPDAGGIYAVERPGQTYQPASSSAKAASEAGEIFSFLK